MFIVLSLFLVLCSWPAQPFRHRLPIAKIGRLSSWCNIPAALHFHRNVIKQLYAVPDMNWDPKSAPKLDFDEDYYSVLEVDPSINAKDLKKAYYKIVFRYHPDNKETEEAKSLANKQMMVINASYKILKDADSRATYDRKRKYGTFGSSAGVKASPPGGGAKKSQTASAAAGDGRSRWSSSASSDTSAGAGDDSFYDSVFNKFRNQPNYEPVESLQDIFADLMREVQKGGPSGVIEDFVSFLEDQIREYSRRPLQFTSSAMRINIATWKALLRRLQTATQYTSSAVKGFTSSSKTSSRSRTEIQSEIDILRTAIDNLQKHLAEMRTAKVEASAEVIKDKTAASDVNKGRSSSVPPQTLEEMEARLAKIEAIKGLEGRISAVEKQQRDLQRQLRSAIEQLSWATTAATTTTGTASPPTEKNPPQDTAAATSRSGATFSSGPTSTSTSTSSSKPFDGRDWQGTVTKTPSYDFYSASTKQRRSTAAATATQSKPTPPTPSSTSSSSGTGSSAPTDRKSNTDTSSSSSSSRKASSSSGGSTGSSSSSSGTGSRWDRFEEYRVDDELEELKKKMGLK